MGRIGFCRTEEAEKACEPVRNAFLAFDSGRAISAEDAFRHVGIFGATGTGKTVSGIVPCMDSAIREGGTVLVIDPKGSLGPYVRGIADNCGRYRDVVEFGTMRSALPLNIINGMSESELFSFAKELYARFTDGGKSWNMDFHAQGFIGARDIHTLLKGIERLVDVDGGFDPADFAPTLPMILDFLAEPKDGTGIFKEYMKVAEITDDLWKYAMRIRGSVFHILNQGKKADETDDDHLRHVAYNHDGIINALGAFLEEPGVVGKFCCAGAPGLDFGVCGGKIILFRFGAGAGGAAACLCRMAIEAFYK